MGKPKKDMRPSLIRVGPFAYRVAYVDTVDGDDQTLGMHERKVQTIWVKNNQCHDQTCVILLHEIIHALIGMVADAPKCDHESLKEQMVSIMAPCMLDVLRRNPKLTRYILWESEQVRGKEKDSR